MAFLDKQLAGNKRFEFVADSVPADKFAVVNMKGYEAISKPFRFTLTLVSDDANIDMRKMLKDSSTLRIYSADGKTTVPYHGVLAEFEQLHQSSGYVFYRAVLVPRLWRLSLNRTSEVYLNEQTIPDILEMVLKDGQLVTSDFEQKLLGLYKQRSYVCQYQESHLDFLSRWMEKEGIYYFFDHDGAADKLMLVDDKHMHDATALPVSYRPEGELDTGNSLDAVQGFVCHRKPLPRQVVLQDYNYRKADLELKVSHAVSDDGFGDVMLYGENFRNEQEGHRYAKLRAEELICSGEVFAGEATAVGLRSGRFMALSHHYRETFNGQYLVTEIHHEGSQAGALLEGVKNSYGGNDGETSYRNTFKAIPAGVQFRAERNTAKPRIAGTMSATVDAEGSGQYAELDEYGQYKVQLTFDRSDKAAGKGSARVRMATPSSGSGYGMHFPLHKGAEVLLSFIGGDPDQPVIVNAVPNSENKNPINNARPALGMVKTAAGNALTFDDTENQQSGTVYSPLGFSQWRVGQKFNDQIGIVVSAQKTWGDTRPGLHGRTQQDISLAAGNALVIAAGNGAAVITPQRAPQQGDVQVMGDYGLINIGEQALTTGASATGTAASQSGVQGTLDIYANHINMYAEPTGSVAGGNLKYGYIMKSGDPKQGAGTAWGWADLYALQNFTTDYTASLATKAEGRVTVLGGSKTSYTQGHSNSATYGDSASVTHGNNIKLVHGTDQSHTYGLSSSMFFGMKNDLTVGATNAVFAGAKTSMSLSAAVTLSVGVEFKASYSATLEIAAGIKTGVNTVVDVSAKAIEAKAAATQLVNSVALISNRTMALQNETTRLETSVFRLQLASANIMT